MSYRKLALMGLIVAVCVALLGCVNDRVSIAQPGVSEPTLEATAEYEREKQEMISERD